MYAEGGQRIAGGLFARGRKVRAPWAREVVNDDPRQLEGKCRRKNTADDR
tara:strand:+ start:3283 stop:3432 length:150 start_codon:yes stop_codon:yes gene_type:complete